MIRAAPGDVGWLGGLLRTRRGPGSGAAGSRNQTVTADKRRVERLADEDLMPLLAEKDPEAFEVFYDRHGGAAFSLAYRIVGDRSSAEDVTQEAFLSIWR